MIFTNQQDAENTSTNSPANAFQSRTFPIVITLLATMILVTACQPAKKPGNKIDNNKPAPIEPNISETSIFEPNKGTIFGTPVFIKPPVVITYEPNTVTATSETTAEPTPEPTIPEPNIAEPNIPEPNITDSNTVKPALRVTFHDKCAKILNAVVDKSGMVHYRKVKLRRTMLEKILDDFAILDRKVYDAWPTNDKIAFWINAYNMQMLRIIADNYPIKTNRFSLRFWPPSSIRHIAPTNKIGVSKWDKYKFYVIDEEFTLSEIEERLFRKQFKDPRALFALTHATLSGPLLADMPYYGDTLSAQLDEQVKRFLTKPRAFKIDRQKKILQISALFQERWYGKDFVEKYGTDLKFKQQKKTVRAVLSFINKYVSPDDTRFLEIENYTIGYINYDWRANDRYKKP